MKQEWNATGYRCEIGYVQYRPTEGDWFAAIFTKHHERGIGSFQTAEEAMAAVEGAR